jgi:hypothetical protein
VILVPALALGFAASSPVPASTQAFSTTPIEDRRLEEDRRLDETRRLENIELARHVSASLRATYPGYDRWTLSDLARLSDAKLLVMRTHVVGSEEWHSLIPQRMFELYGTRRAPGVFGPALLNLVEDRRLGREYAETQLWVRFRNELNAEDFARFDVISPISISLEDNTGLRVPPADVLNYVVLDMIPARDPQTGADISPRTIFVQVPRDIWRGLAANNPRHAKLILSRIQGDYNMYVTMGARATYDAGVSAQSGLSVSIHDRRLHPSRVRDATVLCREVLAAETEIFDTIANDVRTLTGWETGQARRLLHQSGVPCEAPLETGAGRP